MTLLATAAAVVALAVAWWWTPLAELAAEDEVVQRVEEVAGKWWVPPALVLAYTPGSFLLFPRSVITLSAVIAFGPGVALLCALSGNLIAASVGYAAGRRFPPDTLHRVAGRRVSRLIHALRRRELLTLSALRLGPFGPFAIQNVVAGAVRLRLWKFLTATLIGSLPGTFVTTLFGDQLRSQLLGTGSIDYSLLATLLMTPLLCAVLARRMLCRVDTPADGRVHWPPTASPPAGADASSAAGRGPRLR